MIEGINFCWDLNPQPKTSQTPQNLAPINPQKAIQKLPLNHTKIQKETELLICKSNFFFIFASFGHNEPEMFSTLDFLRGWFENLIYLTVCWLIH